MDKLSKKEKLNNIIEIIKDMELPNSIENIFLHSTNLMLTVVMIGIVSIFFNAVYESFAYYIPITKTLKDIPNIIYFFIIFIIICKQVNTQYLNKKPIKFYNIFWSSIGTLLTIFILLYLFTPISIYYLGNHAIDLYGFISFLDVYPINFFLVLIGLLLSKIIIEIKIK